MTIRHGKVAPGEDEAFVFMHLPEVSCSICAPNSWPQDDVEEWASAHVEDPTDRWISVDVATFLGLSSHTPNPCGEAPERRRHWFLVAADIVRIRQ